MTLLSLRKRRSHNESGEPLLDFQLRTGHRRGRELELLVARIKEVLHPEARIESPAHITDRDTGEQREVDVGVFSPVEHGEVFIAIECRDRAAIQDVTWIEQLITKKDSIGADLLIAVTASTFTAPALVKAAKRGVLVRTVGEGLADEIVEWTTEAYLEIRTLKAYVICDPVFVTRLGRVVATTSTRFYNMKTQREENLDQFLSQILPMTFTRLAPKLARHGDQRRITISAKVDQFEILLPFRTAALSFKLDAVVRRHVDRMPVASTFSYDDVAAASRLVEGYRFGGEYGSAGDILIKSDTQESRLILDINNYNGWVEEVTLKAGRPVAMRSIIVVARTGPAT